MPTLRQLSKDTFTSQGNTLEAINAGSLQRIADACELMASNYKKLQKEVEDLNVSRQYWIDMASKQTRTITALKGVITRQKKAAKEPVTNCHKS
jgi:hypothetical protein